MIIKIGVIVAKLTHPKKQQQTNKMGQMAGMKVCTLFDDETMEFWTTYFPRGKKVDWLEGCGISFRLYGDYREILLYAASFKRSEISQDRIDAF